MAPTSLKEFLKTTKQKYLDDVKNDKARDWVVVMGNEAGGVYYPFSPSTTSDQQHGRSR
jgi:hypothetical protein